VALEERGNQMRAVIHYTWLLSAAVFLPRAAVASTPYSGIPAAIPGVIQAVNFDDGGEGDAYHDTTPGNYGGAYRDTDVDIAQMPRGNYVVGWVDAGEWLRYTVNVTGDGTYTAQFRVASLGGGGVFHVEIGGAVVGPLEIPDTGGWDTWQTISTTVTLAAGEQTVRLVMDSVGDCAAGNFDWMRFAFDPGTGAGADSVPNFSHVYVIVMENHELSEIIGNPAAPYINSLAGQSGLGIAYTAPTHPSLPNYMALSGGDTVFSDDTGWVVDTGSVSDELDAAGLSWKAYLEDMPFPCATDDTDLYARRHNPFTYYADIVYNSDRCGGQVVPFTTFWDDYSALPNFAWITPNLCSDMHDCGVSSGDSWLSLIVPVIMGAPDFATSVIFIVWDEGTTDQGGGGNVPVLVISPLVSPGFQSNIPANHFNLLRTIEDAWSLPWLGQSADVSPMSEFFGVARP
jgi:acid phosphatase